MSISKNKEIGAGITAFEHDYINAIVRDAKQTGNTTDLTKWCEFLLRRVEIMR